MSAETKNQVETEQSGLLGLVIADASQTGQPLKNDIRDSIYNHAEAGEPFKAWLASQRLLSFIGDCSNDPALLCEDIKDLEAKGADDETFQTILKATQAAQADLPELFEKIVPIASSDDASALIMRIAGEIRSKLKDSDIKTPAYRGLRPDALLEASLALDPHDPVTYRALSKVYAAQGRWLESWNMLDSLRNMRDYPEELVKPVQRVEKSLLEITPGYFTPNSAKNP